MNLRRALLSLVMLGSIAAPLLARAGRTREWVPQREARSAVE
jgi:hypothetical protein